MGVEPTNGGFADLSLGPLGYRAEAVSIAKFLFQPGAAPRAVTRDAPYFFASAGAIFASRKNRADSSGGVGLM